MKGDDLSGGTLLKIGNFLRSDLGNMIGTAATTAALLVVGKDLKVRRIFENNW